MYLVPLYISKNSLKIKKNIDTKKYQKNYFLNFNITLKKKFLQNSF